ncbi:MAG: hypothetical protein QOI73_826 [Solirubrobacteraceae bacterium]|nr:hypothetical protein [Solirubrobacteraceae bacterium]
MRLLRRRDQIITPDPRVRAPEAARHAAAARYARRLSPRSPILACLLLSAIALPAVAAGAQKPIPTVEKSRHLWSTVNVCDPVEPPAGIGPDTIGIRASMPGSRDGREIMFMRFRVQFLSDADQKWHNVTQGGDSGWMKVGRARYKARQSGRNFRLTPPANKTTIMLRGKVNYEWRLKGEVVRKATSVTTKGHKSSAGAFPEGYSEATCTITK